MRQHFQGQCCSRWSTTVDLVFRLRMQGTVLRPLYDVLLNEVPQHLATARIAMWWGNIRNEQGIRKHTNERTGINSVFQVAWEGTFPTPVKKFPAIRGRQGPILDPITPFIFIPFRCLLMLSFRLPAANYMQQIISLRAPLFLRFFSLLSCLFFVMFFVSFIFSLSDTS